MSVLDKLLSKVLPKLLGKLVHLGPLDGKKKYLAIAWMLLGKVFPELNVIVLDDGVSGDEVLLLWSALSDAVNWFNERRKKYL